MLLPRLKLWSALKIHHRSILLAAYLSLSILVISVAIIKSTSTTQLVQASFSKHDQSILSQLPPAPPIPIDTVQIPPPFVSAQSVFIIDPVSNTILYQKNPHLQLLPASTTKIMTALVALDTYPLDQIITISEEENTKGHTMNLVRGEQITVQNLLYGMLVGSGNDAALALALSYPHGGYSGFVQAMNTKAKLLNLSNTSYKNVSGVESLGHFTSAQDLAILTRTALENPHFRSMVATKNIIVSSADNTIKHPLTSTNQLLGIIEGVTGVKTGWTELAGECLVSSTTRNNHHIITVVLNSQDRFADSAALINWIYHTYTWYPATENPNDLPLN